MFAQPVLPILLSDYDRHAIMNARRERIRSAHDDGIADDRIAFLRLPLFPESRER